MVFKKDLDVWEFLALQTEASFVFYPENNAKSYDQVLSL